MLGSEYRCGVNYKTRTNQSLYTNLRHGLLTEKPTKQCLIYYFFSKQIKIQWIPTFKTIKKINAVPAFQSLMA